MSSLYLFVRHGFAQTVEIAPGVSMPLLMLGGVADRMSNHRLWLELGGRGIDTAYIYGAEVQHEVGQAIATSGIPRDQIFLSTKIPCCRNPNFDIFGEFRFCEPWVTPEEAIEANFAQLGVEYLDLLLLHWPCSRFEGTVAAYQAMEKLQAAGKVRAIGVSNFNASMLDALIEATSVKPAVNQACFSVDHHWDTSIGEDAQTRKRCKELGITYEAYSPLGGLNGVNVMTDLKVKKIATAHGVTSAQVGLRWVTQQGIVAVTASGTTQHLKEDFAIFKFNLTSHEIAVLMAQDPRIIYM